MKIRTNLTPVKLELLSKALKEAAAKKRDGAYKPENDAERETLRLVDKAFDDMLDDIQREILELYDAR